ncbi:ComEA family DNA-binding protein [Chitinophaga arvensicola]|uniref:DNA uptake protein ComE n=1 Tax=Chitinophaga arvensicola TaxID=29529 RepID=A0A1I0NCN6_9BACT|nr:helix-hairpin-helix domain-containing protein [Chitinophaga arvensicola]SEV98688.1 DNA uptake protein ComE [Chitinophaga arvensicola]
MWRTFIREYLRFSRKERQGIVLLVLAMLLTSYFPDLLFYFQRRPVAGSDDLQAAVQAFEAQLVVKTIDSAEDKPPGKAALFYFDPNTLSIEGWQQLGVSERTAGTIGKYIAKGGRFRTAADLAKIYSLPPVLCAQLMPYVRIAATGFSGRDDPHHRHADPDQRGDFAERQSWRGRAYGDHQRGGRYEADSFQKNHYFRDSSFARYRKKAQPVAIDINAADSAGWQSLPGIGPGFARRIMAFRDRLGGFYAVEQVAECYGLPDSVFQKIQPFLQIGNSSLKKLDLNSSDEKSLADHPYIRYKLARLIVQYRSSHAGFKAVQDLRQLPLVDEIIYRKIEHYIEIKY